MNYAQNRHWPRLLPMFVNLFASPNDKLAQHAASRLTINWILTGANADEFQSCLNGTIPQREGVADLIAHQIGTNGPTERTLPVLKRMLHDEVDSVRQEASGFLRFPDVLQKPNALQAVETYLASPALKDDPSNLLRELAHLPGSVVPFADVIFRFCDRLALELADQSRDFGRSTSLYIDDFVRVLLRLYDQAQSGKAFDIQSRCLDSWDLLLKNRVGNVFGLLHEIDQ